MRKLLALCACALVLGACYDTDEKKDVSEYGLTMGEVLLGSEDQSVFVDVEIADSDDERQEGLMNRDSLEDGSGMLFVYFEPTSGGFWMKDTRIPLSIAFIDEHQEIVKILDMDPCTKDPCRVYEPGVTYMAALEVNQGAFDEWGIEEGDPVVVLQ